MLTHMYKKTHIKTFIPFNPSELACFLVSQLHCSEILWAECCSVKKKISYRISVKGLI